MGFPSMLNLGLQNCDSTFVARQDDDDVSTEDRFELQVQEFALDEDTILVCGSAEVVDLEGKFLHSIVQPDNRRDLSLALVKNNVIPHSSVMFRKTAVVAMGGYRVDMHGCEDYDLWLRLMPHGSFSGIQKKVLSYLSNPVGMTRTKIKFSVIWRLRQSRMAAQKSLGVNLLHANLNDLLWVLRQLLNQFSL